MAKPKRKYAVYKVGKGDGCYAKDYCRDFVGETFAVSEKQAINQVVYRNGNGRRFDILGDYLEEGIVVFYYEAEEV